MDAMLQRARLWAAAIFVLTLLPAFAADGDEPFVFTCQPYVQCTGEGEMTVSWGTSGAAVSWVEVAPDDSTHFYASERPRYYDTHFGRKRIGTHHNVKVTGLVPGTTYRYRVYSQEVTREADRDTRYGRTIANNVFRREPYTMRVPDNSATAVHLGIVNDIHQNGQLLNSLFSRLNSASLDFMVLNGDMVNRMDSLPQMYDGILNAASSTFARTIPFYFVRGNHETRGNGYEAFTRLFSTPTGLPYYSFTAGPVAFLVLDAGEDKPDSDIEYSGLARFDDYRTAQARWLAEQVESPRWRDALYRVVLIHVPVRPVGWHGGIDLAAKFLPLLNKAGVDIMLSGHYHSHHYFESGTEGRNFPLLVNSNNHVLDVKADATSLNITELDANGNAVKTVSFSPRH